MKIFISQPMVDKTDKQIKLEREQVEQRLRDKYGDIEILDSLFELEAHPLVYLSKSLEVSAQADLAYFVKGWDKYRGCTMEHECATRYGIDTEEEV